MPIYMKNRSSVNGEQPIYKYQCPDCSYSDTADTRMWIRESQKSHIRKTGHDGGTQRTKKGGVKAERSYGEKW